MSRSRRPQNTRENRKQNLLTPTEAMCILTGQWSWLISLQGCSHFQLHPVPSSHHHLESCTKEEDSKAYLEASSFSYAVFKSNPAVQPTVTRLNGDVWGCGCVYLCSRT